MKLTLEDDIGNTLTIDNLLPEFELSIHDYFILCDECTTPVLMNFTEDFVCHVCLERQ